MRHLLRPPEFASASATQHARIFFRVVTIMMGAVTALLAGITIIQPPLLVRALSAIAVVNGLGLALLHVSHKGRTRTASWALVAGLIALITVLAPQAGGIRSPGVTFYFVFVLMAGVLLGLRAGVWTAGVCMALALGFVLLEMHGRLPPQTVVYEPLSLWLLNCLYVVVVLILLRLATGAIKRSLDRAEAELEERRRMEADQERMLWRLTERVKELRLLHSVAGLVQDEAELTPAIVSDLVRRLPGGWQFPETCEARITFGDIDERTPGWRETPWRQGAPIGAPGLSGIVEVAYTVAHPAADEGPFLAEERHLINSIADLLTTHLQRQHTEQRRHALEQQLRQSQKLQALGTLAGGIAHDFNNILFAIGANADLALEDLPADHAARHSLIEIGNAHTRAVDLVRRILTFSRKRETHKVVVHLPDVVNEAVSLLRASLPKRIQIESIQPAELPPVMADSTQIHQVVMNLGTNAAHAMADQGHLTFALSLQEFGECDRPSLDLAPGCYVRISVTDTGTGIAPEVLERLFEPFYTTKGELGTGLGLSVVHGIVGDHGGAITVQSKLGEGTTFAVDLPVYTSPV